MINKNHKKVCIVGAGIAGIVSATVLHNDGFDVNLFEKENSIGGVWAPSRAYPDLRANTPGILYAFSDYPYPESAEEFPSASQIRNYLQSYTDHFNLRDYIHLSNEVVNISRQSYSSNSKFKVTVKDLNRSSGTKQMDFDFVVICNGVFSKPYLPDLEGMELFDGEILHSSEFIDPEIIINKSVVVVGAGKSAYDCAAFASQYTDRCALVFRKPHWMIPRYFFGFIRYDWLFANRFSELFAPYYKKNRIESFLHDRAAGFISQYWKGQSRLIALLLKMPPILIPQRPLPLGFENIGVGNKFYKKLAQGKIGLKRSQINSFNESGEILLDSGERLTADVVIFATGWRQNLDFIDEELQNKITKKGKFRLYRYILPPEEPDIGFIGYASSTACQFTSEIAAHWLSQKFLNQLALPDTKDMENEIERVPEWCNKVFPSSNKGFFIGPYVSHYTD